MWRSYVKKFEIFGSGLRTKNLVIDFGPLKITTQRLEFFKKFLILKIPLFPYFYWKFQLKVAIFDFFPTKMFPFIFLCTTLTEIYLGKREQKLLRVFSVSSSPTSWHPVAYNLSYLTCRYYRGNKKYFPRYFTFKASGAKVKRQVSKNVEKCR